MDAVASPNAPRLKELQLSPSAIGGAVINIEYRKGKFTLVLWFVPIERPCQKILAGHYKPRFTRLEIRFKLKRR